MKVKILTTLYLSLLTFSSFGQENFEGVVTYLVDIEVKAHTPKSYANYYAQKFGDTLIVHYSATGDKYFQYQNTGPLGLDWYRYDVDKNEFYAKWHSMDSIFYYDCYSLEGMKLIEFETQKSKEILGKKSRHQHIEIFFTNGKESETLKSDWYFNDELPFDGKLYVNYRDGAINKLYKLFNSHPVRWDIDQKFIEVSFEAIKIEPLEIDNSIFEIPESIQLVRQ